MFRRASVEGVGGYNPCCRTVEDYELWLRLATDGPIVNLPDLLVDYRLSDSQHSRTGTQGTQLKHLHAARRGCAAAVGVPSIAADLAHAVWRCAQIPVVQAWRRESS
jgi:hypothetical protein